MRATDLANGVANVDSSIHIAINANLSGVLVPIFNETIRPHDGHYTVSHFLKMATASGTGGITTSYPFDPTGRTVVHKIAKTYDKIVYDIAGACIRNYNPMTNMNFWRNDLGELNCGCNCLHGNPNTSEYNGCEYFLNGTGVGLNKGRWNLEDRWSNPLPGILNSSLDPRLMMEYNGLDYMLAFNLYKLKKGEG